MTRRPIFPIPAGVADPARPPEVPLPRGLTAGKGTPQLVAGRLLAALPCPGAGATWAGFGVVATHGAAHDEIIPAVIIGFMTLMIVAPAIAVVAQGLRTMTMSCS